MGMFKIPLIRFAETISITLTNGLGTGGVSPDSVACNGTDVAKYQTATCQGMTLMEMALIMVMTETVCETGWQTLIIQRWG